MSGVTILQAEIRKYITTPFFWILNGIGMGLLLLYSFLLFGANQVGLLYVTAFDYLVGSVNLYVTNVLPFLFSLFAAYICATEIQWRTIMFPFFDGIPIRVWAAAKATLAAISLLIFIGLYMMVATALSGFLFSWSGIRLENVALSPGSALLRVVGGAIWIGLILYPFGLLAQVLAILSRNPFIGGIGGALMFLAILILQNSAYNPFRPCFAVAQQIAQVGVLLNPAFFSLALQAVLLNLVMIAVGLGALFFVIGKRDVILE